MDMDRNESFRRILMVGSKETLNEIKRALPDSLARKLVGEKAIDLSKGKQFINREIFDLYFDEERRSEQKLWEQIKNEYLRKGRAVVGAGDVLSAVETGRIRKIVVTRNTRIDGIRCPDCDHLAEGMPSVCPECGSESIFKIDLVNEIVELLATTGAEADFVDPIPGLSEVGDIAALLRY
jgi:peptide subunit release factor 1 (eRF1)